MNPNVSDEPTVFSVGSHTVQVPIPGPAGPAPTIDVGEVSSTTGSPSVSARLVGKDSYLFDFVLKQGEQGNKGDRGATGTVAQATVEMIPYDQPASVAVTGNPPNQSMHFKIPKQTPTPGVAGPAGKLQNVRGVLPDDQTVIDLYAEGGPPDTVLLNVLKSSETVKVFISETGVITFKAEGSGPAPEPYKPSQVSFLASDSLPMAAEAIVNVLFSVLIPELGLPPEAMPVASDTYTVSSEKFIKVTASITVGPDTPSTELITVFAAVTVNDGFPTIPILASETIPIGGESAIITAVSHIFPVNPGDTIKIMAQSSHAASIQGGANMNIERFY